MEHITMKHLSLFTQTPPAPTWDYSKPRSCPTKEQCNPDKVRRTPAPKPFPTSPLLVSRNRETLKLHNLENVQHGRGSTYKQCNLGAGTSRNIQYQHPTHPEIIGWVKKHFFKFWFRRCGLMLFVQFKFTFLNIWWWFANEFLPILWGEVLWNVPTPGLRS